MLFLVLLKNRILNIINENVLHLRSNKVSKQNIFYFDYQK